MHPYAQPLADLFPLLLPEMLLVFCACLLFVGGLFGSDRTINGQAALAVLLLALVRSVQSDQELPTGAVFGVPVLFDSLALLTRVIALVSGMILVLLSWHEVPKKQVADHHACLLILIAGVCLVGSAN